MKTRYLIQIDNWDGTCAELEDILMVAMNCVRPDDPSKRIVVTAVKVARETPC
jgi:hypothetical protein